MAQATFRIGEKVLCYETDPGKVNKLYTAVVNQVIIEIVLKVCWICTCTNWKLYLECTSEHCPTQFIKCAIQ